MSREYRENQHRVMELFARDDQPEPVYCTPPQSTRQPSKAKSNQSQLCEDLWAGTRKRHCESREHLRHLLDRHLKPHSYE